MDRLLKDIGKPEKLLEWKAFYELEPSGAEWQRELFGTIAATIVNVNLQKGGKAYDWRFFFPPPYGLKGETLEQTRSRMYSYLPAHMNPDLEAMRLKAWVLAMGGTSEDGTEISL